jgi:hypothetical protein
MEVHPNFGEMQGGLQAPYVMKHKGEYLMLYGNWDHIRMAKSMDGKTFARQLQADGKAVMFTEATGDNTRDPMVLLIGNVFRRATITCFARNVTERRDRRAFTVRRTRRVRRGQ